MRSIYIGLYNEFHEFKIDFMTHKQNHKKTKTKTKTKKKNIPLIVWMVALIKHSTTNKTNSNNN